MFKLNLHVTNAHAYNSATIVKEHVVSLREVQNQNKNYWNKVITTSVFVHKYKRTSYVS